jgi:hypothetical protein
MDISKMLAFAGSCRHSATASTIASAIAGLLAFANPGPIVFGIGVARLQNPEAV